MKTRTDPGKNGFLITALIMMLISMCIEGAWIWVFYFSNLNTAEKKSDFFLSLFPDFLQKVSSLTITEFLLAALAFIFSALSIKKVRRSFRWMAIICMVICLALAGLSIFRLA
ncbi:MAG TPA: hypothetical protein VMT63_10490 [Bacteroidales bacterium]|nr:hypothetical protein [Bacteroidales bacterium]